MQRGMSDIAKYDLGYLSPGVARLVRAAARPRLMAMSCVAVLSGLAWLYLGFATRSQDTHILTAICRPLGSTVTGIQETALALAMWAAMVFAMMLPSAAPMILTYAEIADTAARKRIA